MTVDESDVRDLLVAEAAAAPASPSWDSALAARVRRRKAGRYGAVGGVVAVVAGLVAAAMVIASGSAGSHGQTVLSGPHKPTGAVLQRLAVQVSQLAAIAGDRGATDREALYVPGGSRSRQVISAALLAKQLRLAGAVGAGPGYLTEVRGALNCEVCVNLGDHSRHPAAVFGWVDAAGRQPRILGAYAGKDLSDIGHPFTVPQPRYEPATLRIRMIADGTGGRGPSQSIAGDVTIRDFTTGRAISTAHLAAGNSTSIQVPPGDYDITGNATGHPDTVICQDGMSQGIIVSDGQTAPAIVACQLPGANESDTPGNLPIDANVTVAATGHLGGGIQFGPPQASNDGLGPVQAVDAAEPRGGPAGASDYRLAYGHITWPRHLSANVWFVIVDDICIAPHGHRGHASSTKAPEGDHPKSACIREPATEVINSTTGKIITSFAGGTPSDPMTMLVPPTN
jgi:hypothetical protein